MTSAIETPSPPNSRKLRAERTRREILGAAEARFAAEGFEAARLEDVGADVGVGRSAVLYHFRDKRQLYRAVLDDLFGSLFSEIQRAILGPGDLPARIEDAVTRLVDFVGRRPTAAHIALREAATTDPTLRAEIQRQAAPFLGLMEAILEEGERSGVVSPVRSDPFHFVSAIAGTTIFYVAALPTFVADLPDDPISPEGLSSTRRDVLEIARRLLAIRAPGRDETATPDGGDRA